MTEQASLPSARKGLFAVWLLTLALLGSAPYPALAQSDILQRDLSPFNLRSDERVSDLTQLAITDPNGFVYAVQKWLADHGLFAGVVDGILTTDTIAAINAFCDREVISVACARGPLSEMGSAAIAGAIFSDTVAIDTAQELPVVQIFLPNLLSQTIGASAQVSSTGELVVTFSETGRLYRMALPKELGIKPYIVTFQVEALSDEAAGNMTVDIGDGVAKTALHLEALAAGEQTVNVTVAGGNESNSWLDIQVSTLKETEVRLSNLTIAPSK